MKLIKNVGADRVIDELRKVLPGETTLDIATSAFSLAAFAELRELLDSVTATRLVIPGHPQRDLSLLGGENDRAFRNRLTSRWLARKCIEWLTKKVEVREAPGWLPQSILVAGNAAPEHRHVISGNCPLTTEGLGLSSGNQLSLIQASEGGDEWNLFSQWFTSLWQTLPDTAAAKERLLVELRALVEHQPPARIYFLMLYHLFKDLGEELDEERIIKSATGIRNTIVWKKLFKFQRDGVIGAIDKLERLGGCIIADSVGLGKTFEALAIIKYYELRNDRVLVLVPKRLRDNWTLYKANDRRNILAADRFNYDVLNHTDLSRDGGLSGDIDLAHVNWGNYDLVVIDESHNFRNKSTHRDRETRYDRLMRRIIKEGVKTRVLMLSATPVNNRLADLKNQIAFVTEGNDIALIDHGISSIEATVRQAQLQFNRWLALDEDDRKPAHLMEMLGFDYFTRKSIARILTDSERLDDFKRNPQQFIEITANAINRAKRLAIVDGIKYQRLGDEFYYAQELFENQELSGYLKNMLAVERSVHDHVIYDSGTEATFAQELEKNDAIKVYAKLPGWFKVPTPLGTYNPDWAVLIEHDGAERLYLVVETKSTLFDDELRDKEGAKIDCGKAHFEAIAVGPNPARFKKANKVDDLFN